MATVVISLGSNIEPRKKYLSEALAEIAGWAKGDLNTSGTYETEPNGYVSDNYFLNMAISFQSDLTPDKLIELIGKLEKKLGRLRNADEVSDRTIDIDILFYDQLVMNEKNLTIPHPRLHLRSFILTPLLDILPDLVHPVLKKSVWELYDECKDDNEVRLTE
ncbi:MAG: 2-amino-4-hydroxy-6-hydroxymethyldihydropteridine diphosphokinase [Saprospiraceae bacterium]|nr:2-amino-4-hydroxy-6-hydroxymethyldihydropteridine diphosphokinase [Saprospiraceae bacterium]